jgi:hypothetical protein
MAVRHEDGTQVGAALADITHVWDDQINAALLLFREFRAAVKENNFVLIFNGCHVFADFADTAEGNDPETPARSSQPGTRFGLRRWLLS